MRFLARWLSVAIRLVSKTWRIEVDTSAVSLDNENVIYAFLHGDVLPLVAIHRDQGAYALVSRSQDGEFAGNVLSGLGYLILRGSSSRGGAAALRAGMRCLGEGGALGLAVDGPRGPRGCVSPGVEYLATKTGCVVRWAAIDVSPALRLSTWDRFVIPLPFSRLRVVYGDIQPAENSETGALRAQVEESLLSSFVVAPSRGRLSRALTTADASLGAPSRE
ncbi:MAG: DUF374 domain-containing protein [Myxococcota bacterium]|nr:DUF374 domain-containing protein [Myxococcota bacterium]